MSNDPKYTTDPKKGLPGSFLLFLLAAILLVFTLQSLMNTKSGKVDNSYQLEHLINLDLINAEKSRKISLSDNLVTFNGQFNRKLSSVAENRFKYLSLLNDYHKLQQKKKDLFLSQQKERKEIYRAADQFLHLSGMEILKDGYVIFDRYWDYPDRENHVIVYKLSDQKVQSLEDLYKEFPHVASNTNEKIVDEYGQRLAKLIRNFRSPVLGIGKDTLKEKLKMVSSQVNGVNLPYRSRTDKVQVYKGALEELQLVVAQLNQVEDNLRLNPLRSVRNYKESLDQYKQLLIEESENRQQLDKASQLVSNVTWFFENKEVSTKSLEKENAESYERWFNRAQEEWNNFSFNKGSSFKSPDQPRNLVLDKTFKSEEPVPNYFNYLLTVLFPILLVVFLLYFVFSRQMKGISSGAMNFGKSPARMLSQDKNKITFKDVAGIDEAKEELEEIVDFLKSPIKFTKLGGRIPKGVLCVGPPGTGKTLIAKAVAGEANRPFFSIAGSDFVEMFVGVGASRIRDMFDQAKKNAPCIIFIDEIDAVGRHRGAGIGGGHDEREQTLNQLLVEMDGFDSNEGVILMAATNRPDVLDKALLRPGRFDRRVMIDLPDIKGRHEILKVHARKIKLDAAVDLMNIARASQGSSGADLENILNEAALLAARKSRSAVINQDVVEAIDKVRYGKERRSLEMDKKEKRTTAYHESGHAIVGFVVENWDPIDKVTIVPRSFSLGATHFLPEKNRLSYWKKEVHDQLAVLMGGRCAEDMFLGDLSSGAQQDIEQATQLARSMICQWGMSEELGAVAYEDRHDHSGYASGQAVRRYSEQTAMKIDDKVKEKINEAGLRAKDILEKHRPQVELMTEMLLEFETLDRQDIRLIVENKWNIEDKRKRVQEEIEKHKKIESSQEQEEPPPLPACDENPTIDTRPQENAT